MENHIDKILLISLSNIGDAILTTPVLQALHDLYPQATIDIVADQRSSEIFLHCPYRGEILHKYKNKILRGVPFLLKELLPRKFDLIVDLRTDLLAYFLRAKKRLTKRNRKNCGPHAVEQNMGVLREIYQGDPPQCHIWLSDENKSYARQVLGIYANKRLLGLGPGANWIGKIWPKERYLALTECVKDIFDAVIILGDDDDRKYSEYISINSKLPCVDLCGRTSLLQVAAVQELLKMFIGNDSGLGHMASAVGTSSLTIFGPGRPDRYHPWGENALWVTGKDEKVENVSVDDVVSILRSNPVYSTVRNEVH